MSEISPRPWEIVIEMELEDDRIIEIMHLKNANSEYIEKYIVTRNKENWKHLVKCVNEHDNLVEEVEKFKQAIKEVIQIILDDNNPCKCDKCIDVLIRQKKFLNKYWRKKDE